MKTGLYLILLGVLVALVEATSEKPVLASQITIIPRYDKAKVCFHTSDHVHVSDESSSGAAFNGGYSAEQRGGSAATGGGWSKEGQGSKGLIAIAGGSPRHGSSSYSHSSGSSERTQQKYSSHHSESGSSEKSEESWNIRNHDQALGPDERTPKYIPNRSSDSALDGGSESRRQYQDRPGNEPRGDSSQYRYSYSSEHQRYPESHNANNYYGDLHRPGGSSYGRQIPQYSPYSGPINQNIGGNYYSVAGSSGRFGQYGPGPAHSPYAPTSPTSVTQNSQTINQGYPSEYGYPGGQYYGHTGFPNFPPSGYQPPFGQPSHGSHGDYYGGVNIPGRVPFPGSYAGPSASLSVNQYANGGFRGPTALEQPFGPQRSWPSQNANSYAGIIQAGNQFSITQGGNQNPFEPARSTSLHGLGGLGGGDITGQLGGFPTGGISGNSDGPSGPQQSIAFQTILNQIQNTGGGSRSPGGPNNGPVSLSQYQTLLNQIQNINSGSSGDGTGRNGRGWLFNIESGFGGQAGGFGSWDQKSALSKEKLEALRIISQIGQGGSSGRGTAAGFFGGHFELTENGKLKWVVDSVESHRNSNRNDHKAFLDLSKICGHHFY